MISTSFQNATLEDTTRITELYRAIAQTPGGLARTHSEIDSNYVEIILKKATTTGLAILATNANCNDLVYAFIVAYQLGPKVFDHILSELTIGVHPKYQGIGLGRNLFTFFLEEIKTNRSDISRVELVARESNHKAIQLYESLGFIREGRFEQRIQSVHGGFEADIPMAWFNPRFRAKDSYVEQAHTVL